MNSIRLCLFFLVSATLSACKGLEGAQKGAGLYCRHVPQERYSAWIKTPSTDRSLVAEQKAIVIRTGQESFHLYKPESKGACATDLRTWDQVTQENSLALAAFVSEKQYCEIKASKPSFLGLDPKTGRPWPTDPYQVILFFGLKNPSFDRIDSLSGPDDQSFLAPRNSTSEVSVFSTDACDVIEAVVRLVEQDQN
jgi:hypothetical protein